MAESALERAIKAAGSAVALAKVVGVTAMAVTNWKKRGVPADRVLTIEKATGVKRYELRPDIYPVPRYELRPDIYPVPRSRKAAAA